MQTGDTICAISSGLAPSARIIVRMSGGEARRIATKIIETSPTSGVSRVYLSLRGCEFPAIIYWFDAPRTVTGEDIIEFHLPGNVLLARWMLEALLSAGARQAEPGEFTARAYFNGKIDLAQAEGVAATVSAHSEAELNAARQLMAGELSRRVKPFMEMIADTLALVEAGIDFTDEDISFISPADAKERIERTAQGLRLLLSTASRLEPLTHLAKVVLVGRPNAGKSTLMNALAGENRAVVSPVSGTTRDVLSAVVSLNRGAVELLDVAGLEESANHACDSDAMQQIARDMQQRALQAVERADVVALVQASDDTSPPIQLQRGPDLVVRTKSDLSRSPQSGVFVSALTGEGIAKLRDELDELVFGKQTSSSLVLNDRHLNEIETCVELLARAADATTRGAEFLALELRQSLDALGRILGEITPDDVLGRVFSTFCIGK